MAWKYIQYYFLYVVGYNVEQIFGSCHFIHSYTQYRVCHVVEAGIECMDFSSHISSPLLLYCCLLNPKDESNFHSIKKLNIVQLCSGKKYLISLNGKLSFLQWHFPCTLEYKYTNTHMTLSCMSPHFMHATIAAVSNTNMIPLLYK